MKIILCVSGQDEVFISERSIHNNEDGTEMMMVSASPSSSTNETITSMSNCSSPSLISTPPSAVPHRLQTPPKSNQTATIAPSTNADEMSIESDTNTNNEPVTPPLIANIPLLPSNIKLELEFDSGMPKLRLNTSLASDPALQPDAKDISGVASNDSHHQNQTRDVDETMEEHQHRTSSVTPTTSPAPIDINEMPTVPAVDVAALRVPAFMCGPCGIKFSSLSTLEAHQTYYCSHR